MVDSLFRIFRANGALGLAFIAADSVFGQGGVQLLPPIEATPASVSRPSASPPTAPIVRGTSPVPQALSLDQVVAEVLTADPRLRIGQEEINVAAGEALTASLRPNPTLGIDGQLLPLTRPFTIQEQGGPPQFDAVVSYPIDWFLFGKRKAAMAKATLGVRQTESEYYDLIRRRVRDASLLYYEMLELKALRDVAKQDVDNLASVDAIIQKAVASGGRPTLDANRIRLDLLRSQQMLRDADLAIINAKARLRVLLARREDAPDFDVAGSLDANLATSVPPFAEAVQIALQNRPDLAAARARVDKAQADVVLQHRRAFPEVAAKAGYTRQFQGSIGFRDADTYLVGLDIGLPFSDRNQGNRAQAAAVLAQSHYQVDAIVLEMNSEIEQALNDFRVAAISAQAVATDQLKLAEQVRDAINKANEAGGRPLLDVLDAQRNYRDTFRLYVTSRANLLRASVRVNAALGQEKACPTVPSR